MRLGIEYAEFFNLFPIENESIIIEDSITLSLLPYIAEKKRKPGKVYERKKLEQRYRSNCEEKRVDISEEECKYH